MKEVYIPHTGYYQTMPRYSHLSSLLEGLRVAEVGCSTGEGAAWLARGICSSVIGLDFSEENLRRARAHCRHTSTECTFSKLDLTEPGLLENTLTSFRPDGIIALNPDPRILAPATIERLSRCCGEHGILVLHVPNPYANGNRQGGGGKEKAAGDCRVSVFQVLRELQSRFTTVRIMGQRPLAGSIFSDEHQWEPTPQGKVSLNTELLSGRLQEPLGYLLLCSRLPLDLVHRQSQVVLTPCDKFIQGLRPPRGEEAKAGGRERETAPLPSSTAHLQMEGAFHRGGPEEKTAQEGARTQAEEPTRNKLSDDQLHLLKQEISRLHSEISARDSLLQLWEKTASEKAGEATTEGEKTQLIAEENRTGREIQFRLENQVLYQALNTTANSLKEHQQALREAVQSLGERDRELAKRQATMEETEARLGQAAARAEELELTVEKLEAELAEPREQGGREATPEVPIQQLMEQFSELRQATTTSMTRIKALEEWLTQAAGQLEKTRKTLIPSSKNSP